jgi:hypothetical protein
MMKLVLVVLVALLGGYALGIYSFDPHRKLVTDVVLVRAEDEKAVDIKFSAPVRVVESLPKDAGDIVQIRLRAIAVDTFPENVSLLEQYMSEEDGKELFLKEMRYEGNVPGGPFLVLLFSKPVKFQINETDALLGLSIVVGEV